jgi:hypothetical protein
VTPAEVAEALMRNDDIDVALLGLLELLKSKIKDASETKAALRPTWHRQVQPHRRHGQLPQV